MGNTELVQSQKRPWQLGVVQQIYNHRCAGRFSCNAQVRGGRQTLEYNWLL